MNPKAEFPEPLTWRENEILTLLSENLTDPEIARRLVLSLHSVKWYARRIYGKLGVANRREAVTKARDLGLLASETFSSKSSHNLPRQLSSFIGRDKEIDQVVTLVGKSPLVTLTGPGGVGKSRLALKAAERLQPFFRDGVWLVELAPVTDPGLVPQSLARLFDIPERPDSNLTLALCAHLKQRRLLLVLDNCEHLLDACATLVKALLRSSPGLNILATSRQRFSIQGETLFPVPPLTYPDQGQAFRWEDLVQCEAVQLFIDRASTTDPSFSFRAEIANSVAEICRKLDGLPLAIELAAARIRLLSPPQISDHLKDSLRFLSGGDRTDLPRHQSLQAAIEWSYDLLMPSEQTLLQYLSIFAGGWTLEAAEEVCSEVETGGNLLKKDHILDLLGGLVDQSLVQYSPSQANEPRYRMLETVRQFAFERLLKSGADVALRDRYLSYYYRLAIWANPPHTHRDMDWERGQRLLRELDNFRLALERAQEINPALGLQICLQLNQAVPIEKAHELVGWMERLLEAEARQASAPAGKPRTREAAIARAEVLCWLGDTSTYWGQRESALRSLLESKTIYEELIRSDPTEFPYTAGYTYMALGTLLITLDPEQSLVNLRTALDLAKKHGETIILPHLYVVLINVYGYLGDFDQAIDCAEESLRLAQELDHPLDIGLSTCYAGQIELMRGSGRAEAFFQQSLDLWRKLPDYQNDVSWVLYNQALSALIRGDTQKVLRFCDEMDALFQKTQCPSYDLNSQLLRAWVEWGRGEFEQAARRCEESLAVHSRFYQSYTCGQYYVLGRAALSQGDYIKAARCFRQVDDMADAPRWMWKPFGLHGFALVSARQAPGLPEMAERAAILFGAQENLFAWLPNFLSPVEKNEYGQAVATVRATLGSEVYRSAWVRGQSMPRDKVFAYALATADAPNGATAPQNQASRSASS